MTIKSRVGSERFVFLLPVLVAVVLAAASYRPGQIHASASAQTQGLVGYWSFDEGSGTEANDASGNGNDGTLLNGPLWQLPSACKSGGCLKFDGSNDWVRVNNSSSLQVTGDLTISIWIKPTAVSAKQVLVHKSREFHLGFIETTAPFRLKWHHASEAASGYVTNSINVSQWQHVVLVRDNASKQVRGYKNGVLEVTSSYTVNPTLSSNPVGIGSRYSGGEYFNGFIDEVRIYNRTLSEPEILELYNLTPDTTPPSVPTGLTATAASATQINLSWNASTDDVGVSGYRIYRNGAEVGTSGTTSYQDTGLTASTTYSYRVAAFDGSGNLSAQSASRSATTLAADTNPPVISAVSSSGVSSSSATISWTTNEAADSQVEYGTTTAYGQSTPVNPALVTSHSQVLSGLAAGTTYHYRVKSRDGSNNLAVSTDHVFTTGSVAPQREDVMIASGLSNPTAMAIAPDGRIFVTLQGGSLRVIKNEALLSTPFLTVPVTSNNERGLLGIAFDPGFASNRYIYIYYTATSDPVVNRVSRFRASSTNPDVAESGSETIILNDLPSQTGWHNGGAIHFGNDGKMYIAVGEGHSGSNAQSFTTLAGKMLRIDPAAFAPGNPNAMIPTDNPFYTTATGINRAIWALGLRNPFTFDIQPTTGRIFINNVGENTWEEINEAWVGPNTGSNAGFNFGWPTCEGPQGTGAGNCTSTSFKYPFYSYRQAGGTCAITGGTFYNPTTVNFPSEYVGDYFFADYCAGWIKSIDLSSGVVTDFITGGINDPVDLKVANNGNLFYLSRNGGSGRVNKVSYLNTNQPPSIISHPASTTVPVGQSATFNVSASGTNPLSYQWQRNGSAISGATAASYTLSNVQTSDNGASFRVIVSNAFGNATSNSATLTVSSNQAPTGTIVQPASGALFSGGAWGSS